MSTPQRLTYHRLMELSSFTELSGDQPGELLDEISILMDEHAVLKVENERQRKLLVSYLTNGCLRADAPCSHNMDGQKCSTCRLTEELLEPSVEKPTCEETE